MLTKVQGYRNPQCAPYRTVFEKLEKISTLTLSMAQCIATHMKGDHRMRSLPFPPNPDWNEENANDERSNYLRFTPLSRDAPGDGEWRKNETKHNDHENDTGDIQLPKEGLAKR